ncbi:hypothetical protein ACIG0C_34890 [Kitasatospora aureofaciens]|uniref:Cyanobacterial TRADD-N associated 2 transmembrane domain-containing protein n=1 Tax=Kitasatospora aureofaciens TaxID=1894 RepID=A0A1E7NEW7_KITAU|nr:hypothetical protein [Kitasatospora aureofaciens]ARF83264.1 hypothetical protein B6264_30465 [Kitasatospora aureofaciens]OEV39033.1 hypothetical protein HS99_0018195 [Kitasatospora aureofaciens]GGV03626.1 hypothetical protein GCM10010502_67870 [Kitasatospora aureofaciens]
MADAGEAVRGEEVEGLPADEDPPVTPLLSHRSLVKRLGLILGGFLIVYLSDLLNMEAFFLRWDNRGAQLGQWVQTLGYIVIVVGVLWLAFDALRLLERRERERARGVIGQAPRFHAEGEASIHVHLSDPSQINSPYVQSLTSSRHAEKQERILEDSYVQGISQARVIFWVSIVFLCLGGIVMIGGVAFAILNSESSTKIDSGALAAASGVVSNLLSGIFLYQANRSRNSVSDQAARLQAGSMANERVAIVRELLDSIESPDRRGEAQLHLVNTLIASLERLDHRQTADILRVDSEDR